jgi:hypothetical protein
MGVVLDATRPYKTPNAADFTTKIKIIDSSLNFSTDIPHNKKYIHIFLYSKTLNEVPDVLNIGDIIYLRFFDVKNLNFY